MQPNDNRGFKIELNKEIADECQHPVHPATLKPATQVAGFSVNDDEAERAKRAEDKLRSNCSEANGRAALTRRGVYGVDAE